MTIPEEIGPVLFARGASGGGYKLSALLLLPHDVDPPSLRPMGDDPVEAIRLSSGHDHIVWRYDFVLPLRNDAFYRLNGRDFPVAAAVDGDIRIAYVSCNGQEHADGDRSLEERNGMWRRLADAHRKAPFSLMLHGGDQLYADEVLGAHPTLRAWAESDLDQKNDHRFTDEVRASAERYLFERYAELYAQPEIAVPFGQIPSIMMWDDHDIIDGWGSHPAELLDSEVGCGLFAVSRRMFMLFQMGISDDLPIRPEHPSNGTSLTFFADFPGFDVIAPDLRSERRPERVMGEDGWRATTEALEARGCEASKGRHRRLFMSSVPLLGPRLSWVEAVSGFVPKLRRYEDDLRDQWQSHAHRDEWRRMLTLLERTASNGADITVLSGEIHLASRGEMPINGDGVLHQLVASGIAHPPPPAFYARALGWLATLGESPLHGRPISLKPLPGQKRIYAAERNYLVLRRQGDEWRACWNLEESGRTPELEI